MSGKVNTRTCDYMMGDCCHVMLLFGPAEIEGNKRQAEADRRKYDELLHERDMLNKVCVLWGAASSACTCVRMCSVQCVLCCLCTCVLSGVLTAVDPEEGRRINREASTLGQST